MPRSLINLLGIVVTLAVLAMGILLVAMPIAFQALAVVGQTATVASTNTVYQAQVDHLREEEARLGEIQASVAGLHTQITPANDLDDVFEVIARAAEVSGATLTAVTAGDPLPFAERTSPTALDEVASAAAPDPTATPNDAAPAASTEGTAAPDATPGGAASAEAPTPTGRTQVDFTIEVTAQQFGEVVRFLDELRAGPRLLSAIQTTVAPSAGGYDVKMTALTYVLPDEG